MIDLSLLPPPVVVETLDYESVYQARAAQFAALYPDFGAQLESDPAVKLLEVIAYLEVQLRARINDGARAVMLAFSVGADLDHLGALLDVARLIVTEADPAATPPVAAVYESDERFRQRIQLALEGFSTAGPVGAYTFHALAASAQVKDVSIDSHTAGIVTVTVLGTDGDGTPDAGLLDTVAAALNDEDVRPLCDTVEVQAAQVVPYQVEASLRYYSGPDQALVKAAAEAAVAAYVAEHHRLGHDITRSGLFAALHRPGVQNVILTAPAEDLVVTSAQAAYCTGVTVSSGGLDV